MATLPTCFRDALSNIQPTEDEKHAAEAHAEVSKVLTSYDKLKRLGIKPILIGSYAREASIRRVKDVDVFGRLTEADDTLAPGKAMDMFGEALDEEYDDRVERQYRSFKIDFPEFDLSVDAVPARPCGDHWEIPNRPNERARWVETNPTKLNELTTAANKVFTLNGSGIYVPMVKLVRQVRRTWVADQPGGFFFEIMTYWAFQNTKPSQSSHAAYLTVILEVIAETLPDVADDGLDDPTLPGKTISTKATNADFDAAIKKIAEAATLARAALNEEDSCRAAAQWRKLLGKTSEGEYVFPLPTYCNADGTSRASVTTRVVGAGTVAGAATVPAGSDRFA
ncbi:hypothetical protein ACFOY2_39630 [Nonomuraea purpurea]|uniref:Nucleotidyltransferase n=1 Tax=Nonomuraea purpurea TaxID=1849276 RepID=A0ABV8GHT5_9ACTN